MLPAKKFLLKTSGACSSQSHARQPRRRPRALDKETMDPARPNDPDPSDPFSPERADHAIFETIGKKLFQDRQCAFVVWIGKSWNENAGIRDIKVRVARRQALTFAHNLFRHRQSDNFDLALLEFHLAQAPKIFLERLVIFIFTILFDDRDDGMLRNETREIVDMTVSVVASDAVAEPENFPDAEIIAEALLDFGAAQHWIAIPI